MNILSLDIEEWFHILDNTSTKDEADWLKYPSRIHKNMDRIFDLLDRTNTRASFFVLGWIAEKYPEVVKEIVANGYDIGSHSMFHQLVYEQDKLKFREDLKRSIHTLEDLSGKKIQLYRAPGFSITEQTKWAFEELVDIGITIDSSIFPANRGHGGFPSYGEACPSIIDVNGVQLKEFPINTVKLAGKNVIFSGGGYFRIAPYSVVRKWTKSSEYVMTYFHPRDLDPEQPMIKDLALPRKFKSYVGLHKCEAKLEKWLTEFEFIDISEAEKRVDWQKAKIIKLDV
ncbi:MAG: polysaccharide deacetylase family protein [Crocinitomicaceae bacterium]|nr:polysaccharide deacetylase family protein [Crocinitomicaceae bacterium]